MIAICGFEESDRWVLLRVGGFPPFANQAHDTFKAPFARATGKYVYPTVWRVFETNAAVAA